MARVKGAMMTRKRRKKTLKLAKGYWGAKSRHFKMADITTIDYTAMIDPVLANPDYPKINPITINFPGYMQDPALKISTQFVKTKVFNPNTNLEVTYEMYDYVPSSKEDKNVLSTTLNYTF